jgi:hypothetical protein
MARWAAFEAAAPALAALGRERWDRHGLFLLGTLRRDGTPRISPCEFIVYGGDVWFGMMWQSKKALDLLRDPRFTIHSAIANKDGHDGEFKVYGRASSHDDVAALEAYGAASFAATGWRPSGPFHLFSLDIDQAAFVIFGPEGRAEVERRCAGSATEKPRTFDDGEGSGHTVLHWRVPRAN